MHIDPVQPEDVADLDSRIGVGFGIAQILKDSEIVFEERSDQEWEDLPLLREFEEMAQLDPDRDWRLYLMAPLWNAEYQRQGDGRWILIDKGRGFA
ncbi:MAG: hypothetical protein KDC32_25465 [Saprospiraceae bacterium]|nr:hypothetical protein [Saprospiraceae bacterium]